MSYRRTPAIGTPSPSSGSWATVNDPRRSGTGPSGADGPSDSQLIDRYLLGDQAAFSALVRRHERRVYNLAYRVLGREEDARDATQDAFMTVLRKLSSFRGEAAFTTWLHRVTVNASYDLLRKRQRAPLLERGDDDLPAIEPTPAPDPADASSLS